jgi:hypothetical protein
MWLTVARCGSAKLERTTIIKETVTMSQTRTSPKLETRIADRILDDKELDAVSGGLASSLSDAIKALRKGATTNLAYKR